MKTQVRVVRVEHQVAVKRLLEVGQDWNRATPTLAVYFWGRADENDQESNIVLIAIASTIERRMAEPQVAWVRALTGLPLPGKRLDADEFATTLAQAGL